MSDEVFARKYERKAHAFIILLFISLTFTALATDTFHTVPSRTYCHLSPTPFGCRAFVSDVECDDTIITRVDIFWTINIVLQMTSVFGVVGIMGMIYWNVIKRNRIHQPRGTAHTQEDVLHLSSLYRNEIVLQATCYVGAFILTYGPHIIIYCLVRAGTSPPKILVITAMTLLPLGGFFNILVYSRPKAASLRRTYPNRSRLLCLWLVLRASGEIPEQPFRDDNEQQEYGPHYSQSSNDPIGVSGVSTDFSPDQYALDSVPEENWTYFEGGISTNLDRTVTTFEMKTESVSESA